MGGEADIEDDGALIKQVSSRGYSIQSDRRIKLQPKEDLPKSPDEADGLAMTFAPSRGRANLTWIRWSRWATTSRWRSCWNGGLWSGN